MKLMQDTAHQLPLKHSENTMIPGQLKQLISHHLDWNQWLQKLSTIKVTVTFQDEIQKQNHFQRSLLIETDYIGDFQALILIPKNLNQPNSAILGLHGHGGSMHDFAQMLMGDYLASKGHVVLIPDFKAMEDPQEEKISKEFFSYGKYLMSMRLYESHLCLILLQNLPQISIGKIGLMANSGGSAVAHLIGRLSDQVSALVSDYESSYRFAWNQFCCESIPVLAPYSNLINDRKNFGFPAIKVPYYFAPAESIIENFFAENLSSNGSSVASVDHLLMNSKLTELTRQLLPQSFQKNHAKLVQFLRLSDGYDFPSVTDQELSKLFEIQLIFEDDQNLWKTFNSLRLSRFRRRAMLLMARYLSVERFSAELQYGVIQEISRMPDDSQKDNFVLDIALHSSRSGLTDFTLKLLSRIQLRTQLQNSLDFRTRLHEIMNYLLENDSMRSQILSFCNQLPVDFTLMTLLNYHRQLPSSTLKDQLIKIIKDLLKQNWLSLSDFEKKLLFTVIIREAPQIVSEIFKAPTVQQLDHKLLAHQSELLAKELLISGKTAQIFHMARQMPVQARVDLLYKICIFALQKAIDSNELLVNLSENINSLENPASRAGLREEVIAELLSYGLDKEALIWFKKACLDIQKIELQYNREKHAKRLARLAVEAGLQSEFNSFVEILAWVDRKQGFVNLLNDLAAAKNQPNHQRHRRRTPFSKTKFDEIKKKNLLLALNLLQNQNTSAAYVTYFDHKDAIKKHLKELDSEKRLETMVDVAKVIYSMGLISESHRFTAEFLDQSKSRIEQLSWTKLFELFCFCEDVELYTYQIKFLKILMLRVMQTISLSERTIFLDDLSKRLEVQSIFDNQTLETFRRITESE